MLLLSSQIIGLPVGSLETQVKVGVIKNIVFDHKNGKILAYLVRINFFQAVKALSPIDVMEISKAGIVVKTEEELVPVAEIVRVKKILAEKMPIIGQNAKTESGKGLGKITDVLIDTQMEIIVKYYMKGVLTGERILPAEKVVEIKKDAIIFQEDIEPSSAAEVTA